MGFEVAVPGQEGPVVVGAEILEVFHHKKSFNGLGDLFERRQF
jgi:hypothetical protein